MGKTPLNELFDEHRAIDLILTFCVGDSSMENNKLVGGQIPFNELFIEDGAIKWYSDFEHKVTLLTKIQLEAAIILAALVQTY